MKKWMLLLCAALLLTGCAGKDEARFPELPTSQPSLCTPEETTLPEPVTLPVPSPTTEATVPVTEPYVVDLSEEDQRMLMKMVMAEREGAWCPECCALMMCTVLNRVRSDRFADTVSGVLYSQNQFPPMEDGRYEAAEPNEVCYEAMEMVLRGWDESQGALFYEFYPGETWHSKTLKKLTEHCDVRFYVEK